MFDDIKPIRILFLKGVYLRDCIFVSNEITETQSDEQQVDLCKCGIPSKSSIFIPSVINKNGSSYSYLKYNDLNFCTISCIRLYLDSMNYLERFKYEKNLDFMLKNSK